MPLVHPALRCSALRQRRILQVRRDNTRQVVVVLVIVALGLYALRPIHINDCNSYNGNKQEWIDVWTTRMGVSTYKGPSGPTPATQRQPSCLVGSAPNRRIASHRNCEVGRDAADKASGPHIYSRSLSVYMSTSC
ncbi:hypothetical protein AX16_004871 [Volvariella volvacea WC 439]|nr:hypothetical protein AX16_004871 [Volvariella volvacea WC 439]